MAPQRIRPYLTCGGPSVGTNDSASPVVATPFIEGFGALSRDNRWLAYASNESGRFEVYATPYPSAQTKWLISAGGGLQPAWRGDGKELFYLAPKGQLMAVSVKTGPSLEVEEPQRLFETGVSAFGNPNYNRNHYAVTSDGQRFLITQPAAKLISCHRHGHSWLDRFNQGSSGLLTPRAAFLHEPRSPMVRTSALVLLFLSSMAGTVHGQLPTGTLAGAVSDQTGAVLADARIEVVNRQTGSTRTVTTAADGRYTATMLPPGVYRLTVQATAFKRLDREVSVEAGTTTTVDMVLELGEMNEGVTVAGAAPLIRRSEHQVGGVVTRDQIESVPLNGRNFLELAKLEPGVTNTTRLADGRTFVSSLGGGLQTIPRIGATRVTIDGANVTTPGTVGVLLQVSQDVVQEFHLATVNFDPASSLTSNGAINIVTRSGGNIFQGSGFYFYRDHRLAAYPGLTRDPKNPNPSFERNQFGAYVGGPLRKDRAFFFASVERTDQVGVVSIQPVEEFAALGGIFSTPYDGDQISARVDVRLHANHSAFARYTYDRNSTFANTRPLGPAIELVAADQPG